jgi:hypothetical protein
MFSFDQIPPQDIPYFREVIVMASSCDTCGYRNSEACSSFCSISCLANKYKRVLLLLYPHYSIIRDLRSMF